jgi:hypothetical protein
MLLAPGLEITQNTSHIVDSKALEMEAGRIDLDLNVSAPEFFQHDDPQSAPGHFPQRLQVVARVLEEQHALRKSRFHHVSLVPPPEGYVFAGSEYRSGA